MIGFLIRFREGRVALSTDVEAIFQVLIDPKDCDVLWWRVTLQGIYPIPDNQASY